MTISIKDQIKALTDDVKAYNRETSSRREPSRRTDIEERTKAVLERLQTQPHFGIWLASLKAELSWFWYSAEAKPTNPLFRDIETAYNDACLTQLSNAINDVVNYFDQSKLRPQTVHGISPDEGNRIAAALKAGKLKELVTEEDHPAKIARGLLHYFSDHSAAFVSDDEAKDYLQLIKDLREVLESSKKRRLDMAGAQEVLALPNEALDEHCKAWAYSLQRDHKEIFYNILNLYNPLTQNSRDLVITCLGNIMPFSEDIRSPTYKKIREQVHQYFLDNPKIFIARPPVRAATP